MNTINVTLTNIFNKSIASRDVTSLWRQANVSPISKKGDKSVMNNYWPISLISVISKILKYYFQKSTAASRVI